ncbi:MAG: nicotinamidase [Elusimicrobia bacterium GWA2_69_24]|nr:MAG: nicotinamidase [Elusimicrobia bacterium GWA2_69_24]
MKALLVVDVQNDFLPGGALAVSRGDEVVAVANAAMREFELVVATQDWHPADHGSFASRHPGRAPGETVRLGEVDQVLWPDHCVQGTPGAEFAPGLDTRRFAAVFRKGMDPSVDSYSGFFDNRRRGSTGLAGYLREKGVGEVFILGLATDYCVKRTALDARAEKFAARLLLEGCRGVELRAGDGERAVEEMRRAGVEVLLGAYAVH